MKKDLFKQTAWLPGLAIVALSACTKEVPYDYTDKIQVDQKSIVDTQNVFLYVPSTDLTNRESLSAAGSRPYWQGEESLVKFRFTEKNLEIYRIDRDGLGSNQTNESVVMQIPVEHIDYRCAEDRYGKCTNKEEKNADLTWDQRTQFKADFNALKTTSSNFLPVETEVAFGNSCYREAGSRLVGYKWEAGTLNIQVEKIFNADPMCLWAIGVRAETRESMQTQVVYHYSFARLKDLETKGYKAVEYTRDDENAFGFFTTENRKYDVDFNRLESGKKEYLNRWNPGKKEIVYYLSNSFGKPQYQNVKASTYRAFEKFNRGLEEAGVNFRLVLKEPANMPTGDIRNNTIVLVEDPIASGPLGYGPTVANPETGEIISGRVAMYYANFLQSVKYSYDEVIRELNRDPSAKAMVLADEVKQAQQASSAQRALITAPLVSKISQTIVDEQKQFEFGGNQGQDLGNVFGTDIFQSGKGLDFAQFWQANQINERAVSADVLSVMSKYCNYPSELFPFNVTVASALKNKIDKDLKPWSQMNDSEKQSIIDLLLDETWIPILVHELGHNVGFRHNFGASEDKANFYTKDELEAMGVHHPVPYSSVMDYPYSEMNSLPTLGKYDIAALKFAYNRQIEDTAGKFLTVESTVRKMKKDNPQLALKAYRYCSDEHVEVNPGCKRFDAGTNLSEIVDNMIESYEDNYKRRNMRDDRESFSKLSDGAYTNARRANFSYIRGFMERYTDLKRRLKMKDNDPRWANDPFAKDIKEAALKSGRFFLNVLKTPEVLCAVADKSAPEKITQIVALRSIVANGVSCFEDLNPREGSTLMIVGQAGKALNSIKSPRSDNPWADQIDVRGILGDKIAAAEALFKRQVGNSSYDNVEDNYMDIPELVPEITDTVITVLMGQAKGTVVFDRKDGSKFEVKNHNWSLLSSPAENQTLSIHWTDTPLDQRVATTMGIPMSQTPFQSILLNIVKKNMRATAGHWADRSLMNQLSVIKVSKVDAIDTNPSLSIRDIGLDRYIAIPETSLAQSMIVQANAFQILSSIPSEKLRLIVQKIAAPQVQITVPDAQQPTEDEIKKVSAIPKNIVNAFMQNQTFPLEKADFILNLLPNLQ